jgi:hypothetical protein
MALKICLRPRLVTTRLGLGCSRRLVALRRNGFSPSGSRFLSEPIRVISLSLFRNPAHEARRFQDRVV